MLDGRRCITFQIYFITLIEKSLDSLNLGLKFKLWIRRLQTCLFHICVEKVFPLEKNFVHKLHGFLLSFTFFYSDSMFKSAQLNFYYCWNNVKIARVLWHLILFCEYTEKWFKFSVFKRTCVWNEWMHLSGRC